jgi:DNA-binding NtrC family response regulator
MDDGRLAVVAADDAEFVLSLRREAAELTGRLLAVHSGRDCLRAIEDPKVRLVVLDCSLRDVAGQQLLHLVRRIRPDLGVIVTFDQSDQAQEREARQAGLLYYGDRRGVKEVAAVLRKGLTPPSGIPSGAGP